MNPTTTTTTKETTTMTTYTFYKFDDLDARIGLALKGTLLAITILSEGTSRKGKPGAYTYTLRNPDRRKAAARLFGRPFVSLGIDDSVQYTRIGKAANDPASRIETRGTDVFSLFRQGGNFRFDAWAELRVNEIAGGLDDIAAGLDLVPVANRPLAVRWP